MGLRRLPFPGRCPLYNSRGFQAAPPCVPGDLNSQKQCATFGQLPTSAGRSLPNGTAMSRTLEVGQTDREQLTCCLLALEIADYDAQPVFDQVRLTQEFHNLLDESKVGASSGDLVCVVGEDGALLDFFSDAQECFTTALMLREATLTQDRYHDLPLRIGINLGKAEIADDEFGNPHVSGEGTLGADRLMRLGPPRQISVARPFVELLSRTAPELVDLLEYDGTGADSVDPSLCLYRVSPPQDTGSEDRPASRSSDMAHALVQFPPTSTAQAQSRAERENRLARPWLGYLLFAVFAGVAMLPLSGRLHVDRPLSEPALATLPTTTSTPIPLGAPALSEEAPHAAAATRPAQPSDARKPRLTASGRFKAIAEVARAESAAERTSPASNIASLSDELPVSAQTREPREPIEVAPLQDQGSGTLSLAVKPWGEVYVDGRRIGITPPLKNFDVPAGRHVVTVTNSSLPIYQREVTVEPDTEIRVVHDFTCVSIRDSICREGFGKGLQLRSRFTSETAQAAEPLPFRQ